MATRLLILIAFLLMLTGCLPPPSVEQSEEYQRVEPQPAAPRALNSLQQQAIQAMSAGQYEIAIGKLQRAIKIDPRDPRNWHYLAQNYWHLGDFAQCRAMVHRAMSYSQSDPDLQRANGILLKQCGG